MANQGKLLSYCPTFDNRAVRKTNQAAETIRKSSSKFFSLLGRAGKAVQQSEVNKKASKQLNKLAENMKHRVDEAVQQMNSPSKKPLGSTTSTGSPVSSSARAGEQVSGSQEFEQALTNAEKAATVGDKVDNSAAAAATGSSSSPALVTSETETSRPSLYVSAATTEDEEGTQSQGPSVQRV